MKKKMTKACIALMLTSAIILSGCNTKTDKTDEIKETTETPETKNEPVDIETDIRVSTGTQKR